jgi:hypothetical protein
MSFCTPPYPGRKCSRTCRFPALAHYHVRAVNFALLCRCEGIRGFPSYPARLLPAGNGHKPVSILYQRPTQSDHVTMRRALAVEIEMVKPDPAETDGLQTAIGCLRSVGSRRKPSWRG